MRVQRSSHAQNLDPKLRWTGYLENRRKILAAAVRFYCRAVLRRLAMPYSVLTFSWYATPRHDGSACEKSKITSALPRWAARDYQRIVGVLVIFPYDVRK